MVRRTLVYVVRMGMKSYVLLLVAFIACQFARVQALASADECESVPSDLIHLDHAAQHIQALSQGESIFVEGYMKSVESSHHFVLQVSLQHSVAFC